MAFWLATIFLVMLFGLFLLLATVRRISMFFSELRRIRLADGLDEVMVTEVATERPVYGDLRDASALLLAAEGGFRSGLSRARWEMVNLGNPELREMELMTACGQLLQAQAAIRQANLKLPSQAIDAGQDVPVIHDPVRALAARGRWVSWALFTLAPRFVRGIYGYRIIRAQVRELQAVTDELQERVEGSRRTVEPAPVRRAPLAVRAVMAA